MVWWLHTKHCQSICWGFEILIVFDPYPDPTDQPTPILNRTGDVFVRKLLIRGLPWKKWLLQPLSNHAPKKWRGVRGLWRSTWWLQDIGNSAILKSWLGTRCVVGVNWVGACWCRVSNLQLFLDIIWWFHDYVCGNWRITFCFTNKPCNNDIMVNMVKVLRVAWQTNGWIHDLPG